MVGSPKKNCPMGRPEVCTDSEAVLKWLLAEANWRINILATTLYKEKIGRNPKGDNEIRC